MNHLIDIENTLGRRAERRAGELLAEHLPVIPLGDLPPSNGRGPSALGPEGNIVLPDFAVGARDFGYIECKLKGGTGWRNDWQRREHGIEMDHYLHYSQVEQQFRRRVVLMILERTSPEGGDVLAATLDDLRAFGHPREGRWNNNGKASINWDRRAFWKVGRFEMASVPEEMTIDFDWRALDMLMRQLQLPFEEASC